MNASRTPPTPSSSDFDPVPAPRPALELDAGPVAVIGLGYVGLPLAVAFGRLGPCIGFDLARRKVQSCQQGVDPSGEVSDADMASARHLRCTDDETALADAATFIVAVPTPVDAAHRPDFGPLEGASQAVGRRMRPGCTVVYESTVYPGATEEVCIPILERVSGLRWKRDFWVGYSPERINPGDRERTLSKVVKVVAGDTPQTLERVAALYGRIVQAGVHRAASIKVAEAAKVIENTQRDLNIALMNELALIFHRIGIDTLDVLEAAGTKWNFLPFRPGLVGGHCIGVDPYYLTHKAESMGYHPQVILSGRRINDGMGAWVAEQTVKQVIASGAPLQGAQVIVLGMSFKEDCADVRNTRVVDVVRELEGYGLTVHVHDPVASAEDCREEYGIGLVPWEALPGDAVAVVAAVAHRAFREQGLARIAQRLRPGGVLVDVKGAWDRGEAAALGLRLWRL